VRLQPAVVLLRKPCNTFRWFWKFPGYTWLRDTLDRRYQDIQSVAGQFDGHFAPVKSWLLTTLPNFSAQFDASAERMRNDEAAIGKPGASATEIAAAKKNILDSIDAIAASLREGTAQLDAGTAGLLAFNQQLKRSLETIDGARDGMESMIAADEKKMNETMARWRCGAGDARNGYNGIRDTVRGQFNNVVACGPGLWRQWHGPGGLDHPRTRVESSRTRTRMCSRTCAAPSSRRPARSSNCVSRSRTTNGATSLPTLASNWETEPAAKLSLRTRPGADRSHRGRVSKFAPQHIAELGHRWLTDRLHGKAPRPLSTRLAAIGKRREHNSGRSVVGSNLRWTLPRRRNGNRRRLLAIAVKGKRLAIQSNLERLAVDIRFERMVDRRVESRGRSRHRDHGTRIQTANLHDSGGPQRNPITSRAASNQPVAWVGSTCAKVRSGLGVPLGLAAGYADVHLDAKILPEIRPEQTGQVTLGIHAPKLHPRKIAARVDQFPISHGGRIHGKNRKEIISAATRGFHIRDAEPATIEGLHFVGVQRIRIQPDVIDRSAKRCASAER